MLRLFSHHLNKRKAGDPMITYTPATADDIASIFQLCKQHIDTYENRSTIDYDYVMQWVRRKVEIKISEYTIISVNGEKAGYYRFYKNKTGMPEIDDLYLFPEYQNQGIGTAVIQMCCASVNEPVMLYVFIRNKRAFALYQRLGFEITQTIGDSRYIMKRENQTNGPK